MGEGQNQRTIETREYHVKELSHFVNQHNSLPKETLLKWIVRVTNFETVNALEWKSMYGLKQDPQFTVE